MPRPKTAAATYKRLTLRLPQEVYDALHDQAQTMGRAVNTHAIFALRTGLGIPDKPATTGEPHGRRRSRTS